MRVAFDSHWWDEGPPSGRHVLRSIVGQWRKSYPEDHLVLFGPIQDAPDGCEIRRPKIMQHALSNILEFDARTADCDAAVLHNFSGIRSNKTTVTFIHDVIYRRQPNWFSPRERVYLSLISLSARFSPQVITSTQSEAQYISSSLTLRRRAVGVGLAVPEGYLEALPEQPNLTLRNRQFYLCVGRLNVRKNLKFVISALKSASRISGSCPLVVVGQPEGLSDPNVVELVRENSEDVIFAGFIPDTELKWLYENCKAFIFASLDEGFGLPILEAELAGAPSVLSDIRAFREVSRNPQTQFFNPRSTNSFLDSLDRLADDGEQKIYCRTNYSWMRTVQQIRELIE